MLQWVQVFTVAMSRHRRSFTIMHTAPTAKTGTISTGSPARPSPSTMGAKTLDEDAVEDKLMSLMCCSCGIEEIMRMIRDAYERGKEDKDNG